MTGVLRRVLALLGILLAGAVQGEDLALPAVLFFVRTDCPISNRYAPEMARLAGRFAPSGISFYLVYPDLADEAEGIEAHRRDHSLRQPWIRDLDHTLVRRCSTKVTPEAAILARDGTVVYHGRIDDRWIRPGKARARAIRRDLESNLEALVAGRPIEVSTRKAVGCPIPAP